MADDGSAVARVAADTASLADASLPVESLRDATPHLRRPFTPEAIKFKVQSVFAGASGCLIVPYIDARLVVERLNRVCPDLWFAEYQRLDGADKLLLCRLTVDGVTRIDVGESTKGLSKDVFSDALKRAAVHFGVGVSIYALPHITLWLREEGPKPRIEERKQRTSKGEKDTIVLTEHGHMKLREGYAAWLEKTGVPKFGDVLDHGDVEGETIDPEVEVEPDDFVPEAPPAVDDEAGQELLERCKGLYDEIRALGDGRGGRVLPPGQFNGWLIGAQHSHVELERLVEHLEKRKGEIAEQFAEASS